MGKISSHGNHMTEDHGNWVPQHDLILDLTFLTTQKFTFHKFLKLPLLTMYRVVYYLVYYL